MKKRKVWTNGVETWIAPTLEAAREAALRNICGPEDLDEETLAIGREDVQWDDWYEMSEDKVLTVHSDDGEPTKIQTAAQWAAAAKSDTEFLCSTEW